MSVKSAERVLEIFELLKNYPEGLTAKQISTELGYAGSSTFELVKTLEEHGYLIMTESKRYSLGAKLIQLGAYAATYLDLNKIAAPILRDLMNDVQESVFMAQLSGNEIVYIAIVDSFRSITTNARLGGRKPIYCTGLGKAFLAFMPEKEREKILDGLTLEPITKHTVTDKTELRARLEQFKKQGYAVDDEEIEVGLWCAAAPVYNSAGQIEAAISISGPSNRMKEKREHIVTSLQHAARALSRQLGYTG